MGSNPFLFGILALAILNGMFSLFLVITTTRIVIPAFAPALLLTSPGFVIFFGYLLGATATVIVSGIPAALFERATGRKETDTVSWAIWLVTAMVISFPAILRAVALTF
jgi:hypothetical protein